MKWNDRQQELGADPNRGSIARSAVTLTTTGEDCRSRVLTPSHPAHASFHETS